MENQTHQPQSPYPPQQQPSPQQSTYPQQPHPQQPAYTPYPAPYQVAPQTKSYGISIASFVISGIAILFFIGILLSAFNDDPSSAAGVAFGSILFYFPIIALAALLAILDLAINKTKVALAALLTIVAQIAIYVIFSIFYW